MVAGRPDRAQPCARLQLRYGQRRLSAGRLSLGGGSPLSRRLAWPRCSEIVRRRNWPSRPTDSPKSESDSGGTGAKGCDFRESTISVDCRGPRRADPAARTPSPTPSRGPSRCATPSRRPRPRTQRRGPRRADFCVRRGQPRPTAAPVAGSQPPAWPTFEASGLPRAAAMKRAASRTPSRRTPCSTPLASRR